MTPFPGMEGLDALMARFQPTPEQQAAARRDQLLTMGLGLLGTQKGYEMPALARSGLLAMQARDRSLNGAQEQAMQRMQAAQAAMQLQEQMRRSADSAKAREIAMSAGMPGAASAATPGAASSASSATTSRRDIANFYANLAQKYRAAGLVEEAAKALDLSQKAMPEVTKTEKSIDPATGKVVLVNFFKDGTHEVVNDLAPVRKISRQDLGGGVQTFDEDTGQAVGNPIPKSITPDTAAGLPFREAQQQTEAARLAETIANNRRVDSRAREFNAVSREGVNATKALAQSNKQIEQVHTIRKEANALPDVQAFRAAVPMLNSAMTAPDTRAGDLDIIYAVGKALDPGSVVREGELNLVIKSGTLPQQLVGAASYVMGGGKLPPDQRAQLIAMLRNRVSQLKTAHDAALAPFEAQARANNLPADQLFIQPPPVNEAPASAAGNYDSLPSGAIYTAPDGTQRRKR